MAVIIGRFQPFHLGHLYLIKYATSKATKIVIFIGSSNVTNVNNPFSYKKRKKMIEQTLLEHNLSKKVISIIPIKDYPSDTLWLRKVLQKCKHIDVIIGHNSWVNNLFIEKGYEVIIPPFYKRNIYSGTKIRKNLRKSGKLKS